ncbi:DNA-directed DNA polymerase [Tanacetum coccineum]|uniref:DNA-directed DNA polymerase n=1 Tax=Tanacetum coccineum TaxID=301880 RepID=A0ABQ5FBC8_9ASTR
MFNKWILDSFNVEYEYAKEIRNSFSRRFDEYKRVFDNEVENLSNEYTLRIGKRGYEEEEELWRSGDEKTNYEPPFMDVKTFEVKRIMNALIIQQRAPNDALVAPNNRAIIGKCNMRIETTKPQKEVTYQVALDALKLTACYKAFLATANVPKIYMHQFWFTIKRIKESSSYDDIKYLILFSKMQSFKVGVEVFCDVLQICPRIHSQEFVEPPTHEETVAFIKEFGYQGELESITEMHIDHMSQPWRTFDSIINICLSGKVYGKLIPDSLVYKEMMKSKAYKTYLDFGTVKNWLNQSTELKLKNKKQQDLDTPTVTKKKTPEQSLKLKGMEMLSDVAMLAAETKKAIKASKRDFRSQYRTGGSSEGAGSKQKVLDELKGNTKDTNEEAGSKPEVPDVSKTKYFEDYYSKDQYAVSIKEDRAYLYLHSPKTTKERRSIRRIQKMSIRRIQDIVNLDNSTSNVLIPLDSWTSGLLEYQLQLSRAASRLRPYHFTYSERKLSIEEMLYKFIDEIWGTRVVKSDNNTPMIDCEAKGVTTRGGKNMTQDAQNNDTNVRTKEPLAENHDEPVLISIVKQSSIKEKDPGSFTIPCDIGQLHINNALSDLGASISLMPYTTYEKLGLGEPKTTRISLELADRSIQCPRGITENVLIKVDKFVLPIDFVILDMPEDSRVPIILRRPFLATARAIIDVFNKKITLRVGDDEVIFDVDQSIKRPPTKDDECFGIDDLDDTIIAEAQELLANDEPDSFLSRGLEKSIDQSDLEDCEPIDEKKPELKDLPHHVEYAYLHDDKSFPIIISSELSKREKISLLQVLEKRKGEITWKMSDIKGISPSYYTNKILMEDDFKPVIQPQRRLNPKVQDVVKNETIKLLDSGLIYPILDSSWVSPIHVVPKKRGMIVVLNDDNELIPCRTVTGCNFAVGAILGQRIDGNFKPIYYASKTLNNAQEHYTTTEKELLAVVFSFDKFHPYLVLSKTIVYTDHSALKHENPELSTFTEEEIADEFLDEHLMALKTEINNDEPWMNGPIGGHHRASVTGRKVYESGFFWPSIFKDYVMRCDACQRSRILSSRSEMPQKNIQERTKKWHDSRLRGDKDFKVGDLVLQFNSRFKMHPGKLKSRWYGPNVVKTVYPYGTVEITIKKQSQLQSQWTTVKKYHERHIDAEEVIELEEETK